MSKKSEKRGEERKGKIKVKTAVSLLNPKFRNVEILLSAHARTSQVDILHLDHSRPQCLRVWECARKLWETLRRSSQNLAIWALQRMLFDPTQTFCVFYICFITKCFVASVLELKKFS